MVRRIVHRFSVIAAQSGDIHRLFHCRPVCEPTTPYVGWDWPAQKSGISGQLIYPVFVPDQQAGIARCLRA